jgi:glycosyltransferase involved in cell wall biosynthesis
VALPQFPQDPSSGAARSTVTIGEMLAQSGFSVEVLATTATERPVRTAVVSLLEEQGVHPESTHVKGSRPELRYRHRGVDYRLLDTTPLGAFAWQERHGRRFGELFDEELVRFDPDLLFTYGGEAGDVRRRRRARQRGVKVVFSLRNLAYLQPGAFEHVDAILSNSEFTARRYREVLGVESTPLPLPLDMDDVRAPERQAVFVTFINPSREKGVMFFARLAEEIGVRRPDAAVLVVESRGTGGMTVQAGLAGGFELRRHENLMVAEPAAKPREIYAVTRVLLAPSLWEEPAGRVVAEALVNGIPAIVSDRGGLAEVARGGAFVLPIPADITPETARPPDAPAVEPWFELIGRLLDDEAFYQESSRRAHEAGRIYERSALAQRYAAFFEHILA